MINDMSLTSMYHNTLKELAAAPFDDLTAKTSTEIQSVTPSTSSGGCITMLSSPCVPISMSPSASTMT